MHTVVFGWFGASAIWFLPLLWRLVKSALPDGAGLRGPGTIRLWLGFFCVLIASCTLEASLASALGVQGYDGIGQALAGGLTRLTGKVVAPLAMLALFLVALPWLIGFRWSMFIGWANDAFGLGLSRRASRDDEPRAQHRAAAVETGPSHSSAPINTMAPKKNGRYARPTVWKPPSSKRAAAAAGAAGVAATHDARGASTVATRGGRRVTPVNRPATAPAPRAAVEPVAPAGWLNGDAHSQHPRTRPRENTPSTMEATRVAATPPTVFGSTAALQSSKAAAASGATRGVSVNPAVAPARSASLRASMPSSASASTSIPPRGRQPAAAATPSSAQTTRPGGFAGSTNAQRTQSQFRAPAYSRSAASTESAVPTASVQETLRSIEENAARWTSLAGASLARRTAGEVKPAHVEVQPEPVVPVVTDVEVVPPVVAVAPVETVAPVAAELVAPIVAMTPAAALSPGPVAPEPIAPIAPIAPEPASEPPVETQPADAATDAKEPATDIAPVYAEVAVPVGTPQAAPVEPTTPHETASPPEPEPVATIEHVEIESEARSVVDTEVKDAPPVAPWDEIAPSVTRLRPAAVDEPAPEDSEDEAAPSNVVRFPFAVPVAVAAPFTPAEQRAPQVQVPQQIPAPVEPTPTQPPASEPPRPAVRGHTGPAFEFHAPAASHIELPALDLLAPASADAEPVSEEKLAETGALIEQRLQEFKVPVTVVGASAGPVITRFEVEPALGVRGSQIVGLMKDLSRGLGLTSIRVVETIPGKTCMGLELPNAKRQTIRLSEILQADVYQHSKSNLTIALGKDITGHPVVTDLAKAPHMLVAGTTGSGKSVAINAMIVSLLYKATPEEVRMIMIDPKMLELSVYEGIPHLLAPVVTDMKLAANALNWCVGEMEKRYRLMSAVGVRNLQGFNQKIRDAAAKEKKIGNPFSLTPDAPEPLSPLPLIVVVIDELADLMMVAGKKIEELIARLAQKARAAGIHLILATQRPSVDVITGLIKANIPTRVAFQVSSKIDSRTILDQMGAESLLGQGDMLFLPPGTGYPQRVHGAFVADEEVHRIVEHLKQFGEPEYVEGILDGPTTDGGATQDLFGESPDAEADPLYDEAVAFVVRTRRASISAVQRQLRIGYNRAARLVEQMESAGLVSAMGTNGNREVLAPGPAE